MKKILLPVCMAFSLLTTAQQTDGKAAIVAPTTIKEGKVVYERVIQMQINIQGMDESIARQLPRTRTDNFELQFGNNKSLWKQLPNVQEEANTFTSSGGNTVMIRGGMMGGDDVTFTDFETGKRVDQRELDSKNYLVDDDIQKLSWKLTEDTKTILGYVARKAVAQQYTTRNIMSMENGEMKRQQLPDTVSVVAWFTLQVPVPAGPVFQGQLPGLILELDMNKGRTLYKAVEVSPKVNVAGIKEPKGGKRITQAEYVKERDKVMEEMRKNMPAGGNFRIRTGS